RDRIVVERRARNTGENVVLGVAALAARGVRPRSVVSVAWPFAARRCVATFARHHPEIAVRSAPAFGRPGVRSPLTAATARWAVDQLERLLRYGDEGIVAGRPVPPAVVRAAVELRALLGPSTGPAASAGAEGRGERTAVHERREAVLDRR
ncbi:MAG: hypothetical protein AB7L84_11730, partial [Acidimicrobiia bacterium]